MTDAQRRAATREYFAARVREHAPELRAILLGIAGNTKDPKLRAEARELLDQLYQVAPYPKAKAL